ncbi:MAG TPA: HIRAN domain-containing protein [Candidatus Saccharimonadales bacterium]|nr:HIRAN domain-containing protein [Candidatus Saccharimonadales bacterium]
MGIIDWLFPSTRPARYASVPLSPPTPSAPQVFRLKLVPKIFDLEGDGDLIWTGFMVEGQQGNRYGIGDPLLAKNNFHVFRVAGVSHRSKQLQNEAFAPATLVELVKEDSNPHDKRAVSVWDSNKKLMVGYVPREDAAAVRRTMAARSEAQALIIAHCMKKKKRIALRIIFGPLDGLT